MKIPFACTAILAASLLPGCCKVRTSVLIETPDGVTTSQVTLCPQQSYKVIVERLHDDPDIWTLNDENLDKSQTRLEFDHVASASASYDTFVLCSADNIFGTSYDSDTGFAEVTVERTGEATFRATGGPLIYLGSISVGRYSSAFGVTGIAIGWKPAAALTPQQLNFGRMIVRHVNLDGVEDAMLAIPLADLTEGTPTNLIDMRGAPFQLVGDYHFEIQGLDYSGSSGSYPLEFRVTYQCGAY